VFHLKRNPDNNSICKLWWHQHNKTDQLFFRFYLLARTYRTALQQMLKISTTFLKRSIYPKFCYSRYTVVLFGTFLSGYALLNASRTAENDLSAKSCLRMNTRSAHEFTMFVPAQTLRNWREQRPSNQGDLDSSVTGRLGEYYTGVNLLLISFLYRRNLLLGCVLNGALCVKKDYSL
jgi:hypothetical protein